MGTKRINRAGREQFTWNWNCHDAKGREFGMFVATWEVDYIEAEDGHWSVPAGHYYVAMCMAAKNGQPFGASQHDHRFNTVEERDAFIAKRLKASEKAAQKKAA